ncbi:hypothetical protein Q3G72_015680 [Acer saccharum]|nr:hypothetical protein Q3G72_015680 [Acer saccharum]
MRCYYNLYSLGFLYYIGRGNVLEAELWGLFEGLTLAWSSGSQNVLVETDSLCMVQLLAKDIPVNHLMFSMASGCSALINLDWRCLVSHVYRERNKVVDGLARLGHGMEPGLHIFEGPPLARYLVNFAGLLEKVCLFQISPLSFPF